jgi:hypothetical protein
MERKHHTTMLTKQTICVSMKVAGRRSPLTIKWSIDYTSEQVLTNSFFPRRSLSFDLQNGAFIVTPLVFLSAGDSTRHYGTQGHVFRVGAAQ